VASLLNTTSVTRLGPRRLSAAAFALQLPASLAAAIVAKQHAPLIVLAPTMFVQIALLGALLPNAAALALAGHRASPAPPSRCSRRRLRSGACKKVHAMYHPKSAVFGWRHEVYPASALSLSVMLACFAFGPSVLPETGSTCRSGA
jgi:hypothetical protein